MTLLPYFQKDAHKVSKAKRVACKFLGVPIRCDHCEFWNPEKGKKRMHAICGVCDRTEDVTGCSDACADFTPVPKEKENPEHDKRLQ